MTILYIAGIGLVIIELFFLFKIKQSLSSNQIKSKQYILFGLILVPLAIIFTANYHVFESSKTVESCMGCHVMKPFGNDMLVKNSQSLAARHAQNNWIQGDQCYGCHKDYGLNGTFKAKTDGYRHLMRYITNTYEEPIAYRGEFNMQNCLSCHEKTDSYKNKKAHLPVIENYTNGDASLSCLNCHGRAHPSRQERTPGHPMYEELMKDNWKSISSNKKKQLNNWANLERK